MNYIYDIYANLQKKYYDIYDWNKEDKLIHIKKIPIVKIKTLDLKNIIKNENKIENRIINQMKNQTEIFNDSKKRTLCAFTDGRDEIIVKINKNGNIIQKSSIHFTDDYNNFSTIKRLNFSNFYYTTIKSTEANFLDRKSEYKKNLLLQYIDSLSDEKLSYLYFECFSTKYNNSNFIKKKLKKEIINNNDKIFSIVDNFLKLIQIA